VTEDVRALREWTEMQAKVVARTTLHAAVGPRAGWALHRDVGVACGHPDPRWLDWCTSAASVLCNDCLRFHLGSEAGDRHWTPELNRCLAGGAGPCAPGQLRPVQVAIRLDEPVMVTGGVMLHDGEVEAVPMLWLCENHRDLIGVEEIHIEKWCA
jgi:hypothetical protein